VKVAVALLLAAVLGLIAVLPWVATPYLVAFVLIVFMYLSLAGSWNVISGFAGYVSFGHVAFFGIGAYVAALLVVRWGVGWPLASLAAGAASTLAAAAVGWISLRLKGPFFAITMLGLSETLRVVATAWASVTGGAYGISLPPTRDLAPFYYGMALLAGAAVLMNLAIARSDFGLQLLAIREDEAGAEAAGVDTTRCKLVAFALSAVLPGVAGGVYARYISYIEPQSVFAVFITAQMLVMTIFGGRGTVLGPIIGAVALSIIAEVTWANFPSVHRALYGVIIVAIVLFLPDGIVEVLKAKRLMPRSRLL
jgi:branched-chain amino acid transport system permease protein